MEYRVKLGVAPTRRSIFSKEDAHRYRDLTKDKLNELGIDYVDIGAVSEEGLLRCQDDVSPTIDLFKAERVDAVFFPHVNFGTEDVVAKVARELGVPVLLWGPRDEAPLPDGSRLRDTQCGLFATGKVLRRFNVPFTYIVNCELDHVAFERGISNFISAANIVKEFRRLRILQISTRPGDFYTMMCNEGELLERFGIELIPVAMSDFVSQVEEREKNPDDEVRAALDTLRSHVEITVPDEAVLRVAALKSAMKGLAVANNCSAVAIQCWNALQRSLQVMPCMSNSLLSDDGIPVACETDIHGAITAVIAQAAAMGRTVPFFADWSVRHPENDNGELLQHCGPWPISLVKEGCKPQLGRPFAFPEHYPGACIQEIRGGLMTMLRFDGDHGEYSILVGSAKGIDGPKNIGTYVWIEVENWPRLEEQLVKGPYVHHCVGIHGDIRAAVAEACNYIPGLKPDFYETDMESKIGQWLRGEILEL